MADQILAIGGSHAKFQDFRRELLSEDPSLNFKDVVHIVDLYQLRGIKVKRDQVRFIGPARPELLRMLEERIR